MTSEGRRDLVSIQAAAQEVGVCRRTIYNWLYAGKLEYLRTAGGSVRIVKDSLWRQALPQGQKEVRSDGGA